MISIILQLDFEIYNMDRKFDIESVVGKYTVVFFDFF